MVLAAAVALVAAAPVENGKLMNDYVIDVRQIEELQTLKDIHALEAIFTRARSAIVNGAVTQLVRTAGGHWEAFDELSTLSDLEQYKKTVFKYLP